MPLSGLREAASVEDDWLRTAAEVADACSGGRADRRWRSVSGPLEWQVSTALKQHMGLTTLPAGQIPAVEKPTPTEHVLVLVDAPAQSPASGGRGEGTLEFKTRRISDSVSSGGSEPRIWRGWRTAGGPVRAAASNPGRSRGPRGTGPPCGRT